MLYYLLFSLIYFISKLLTAVSIIVLIRYGFFFYRTIRKQTTVDSFLTKNDTLFALMSIVYLFTLLLL